MLGFTQYDGYLIKMKTPGQKPQQQDSRYPFTKQSLTYDLIHVNSKIKLTETEVCDFGHYFRNFKIGMNSFIQDELVEFGLHIGIPPAPA